MTLMLAFVSAIRAVRTSAAALEGVAARILLPNFTKKSATEAANEVLPEPGDPVIRQKLLAVVRT